MALIATLITQSRTLCRDLPTSNRSVRETPKGLNDGTNTHFAVQSPIIVIGSLTWSSSAHYRVTTGVTLSDPVMGYITISPAPEAGSQNAPFYVDYYYQWFADSDYTEFLNDAARDLMGNGDPTLIKDAMTSILLQYTLGHFWQARAGQYASRYSSSGGMAGQSVDKVADRFMAWAKQAFDQAKAWRDQYYEDLSQRNKFASTAVNYPIDPMTPRR